MAITENASARDFLLHHPTVEGEKAREHTQVRTYSHNNMPAPEIMTLIYNQSPLEGPTSQQDCTED